MHNRCHTDLEESDISTQQDLTEADFSCKPKPLLRIPRWPRRMSAALTTWVGRVLSYVGHWIVFGYFRDPRGTNLEALHASASWRYGLWSTYDHEATNLDAKILKDHQRTYRRSCVDVARRAWKEQLAVNLLFFLIALSGSIVYVLAATSYFLQLVGGRSLPFIALFVVALTGNALLAYRHLFEHEPWLVLLLLCGGWSLLAGGAFSALHGHDEAHPSVATRALGAAAITAVVVAGFNLFGALLAWLSYALARWTVSKRRFRQYPHSYLLGELQDISFVLLDGIGDPLDIHFRRWLISRLDASAIMLETALPRALRLPDATHQGTMLSRYRAAAAAVRECQLMVSMPTPGTSADIRRVIYRLSVSIACSDYELLPTGTTSAPVQRRQLLGRWISTGRHLVLAVIPAVLLTVVGRTNLDLPDYAVPTIGLFAFVWALVNLLAAVDPAFSDKLTSALDLTAVIRGGNPPPSGPD